MAEQDKAVEELLDRLLEGRNRGHSRNGRSTRRLKTETGELDLEIPRDREGDFDPLPVPTGQRQLPGFAEKAIALCIPGA